METTGVVEPSQRSDDESEHNELEEIILSLVGYIVTYLVKRHLFKR